MVLHEGCIPTPCVVEAIGVFGVITSETIEMGLAVVYLGLLPSPIVYNTSRHIVSGSW